MHNSKWYLIKLTDVFTSERRAIAPVQRNNWRSSPGVVSTLFMMLLTLALPECVWAADPPIVVTDAITLTAQPNPVSLGGVVNLTARMPIANEGSISQEVTQQIDPALIHLTGLSDIIYPAGWTLSFCSVADCSVSGNFTNTVPANAAAWAAVRAVKAKGTVNSVGQDPGGQVATGTSVGSLIGEFQASGKGDGYQAFFDPGYTRVFNIYHHQKPADPAGLKILDCHVIATGETCAGFPFNYGAGSYDTTTGVVVNNKIWIPAPSANEVADTKMRCVDIADVVTNGGLPSVCESTSNGGIPLHGGLSAIAHFDGVSTAGTRNEAQLWLYDAADAKAYCFDTATASVCGSVSTGLPTNIIPTDAARSGIILSGDRIYATDSARSDNIMRLACVLTTGLACPGWESPKTLTQSLGATHPYYPERGKPVELPDKDGNTVGVCYLNRLSTTCWDSNGVEIDNINKPNSLISVWNAMQWKSPLFTVVGKPIRSGSRVYWGNGYLGNDANGIAGCWDATLNAGAGGACTPVKGGIGGINNYTVTPDPEIADCLWVTTDPEPVLSTVNLKTGKRGCAGRPFVLSFKGTPSVPRLACNGNPNAIREWRSFVLNPADPLYPYTFSSAKLTIKNSAGTSIQGWSDILLVPGQNISLTGLSPAETGINPDFSIVFTDLSSVGDLAKATASVEVVGDPPELCLTPKLTNTCPTSPSSATSPGTALMVYASGQVALAGGGAQLLLPDSELLGISDPNPNNTPSCGLTSLSGQALMIDGSTPVAGVRVSLLDLQGNPVLFNGQPITTTTDASGHYSFPSLYAGSYKVSFPNVGTATVQLADVESGANGTVTGNTSANAGIALSGTVVLTSAIPGVVNAVYDVPPPLATNDAVTTPYNTPVTLAAASTDAAGEGTTLNLGSIQLIDPVTGLPVEGSSVTIPNEGTFVVNGDGTVTFTPVEGFTGVSTIPYTIKDALGQTSNVANLTVTVLNSSATPAPVANDDFATTPLNTAVTLPTLLNDAASTGSTLDKTSVKLCGSSETPNGCTQTSVTTTEGVWTVNTTTGDITFTPALGYTGTTPPIDYIVQDLAGGTASASQTVTVIGGSTPVAVDDSGSTAPETPVTLSILTNDAASTGKVLDPTSVKLCEDDPLQVAPNCDKTSVDTDEGTWTVEADGSVTFLPTSDYKESGQPFTGTASLPYQVADTSGQIVDALITVIVNPTSLTATDDTATTPLNTNVTLTPASNDKALPGAILNPTTVRLCGNTPTQEAVPNCTQTSVTTDEGTWTVQADGTVIFDPIDGYTDTTPALPYVIRDSLGNIANATLTVTVEPLPAITLSGVVFQDDGGTDGTAGDGLQTTGEDGLDPGNLNVVILDSAGKVLAVVPVDTDGTWSASVAPGTGYTAYLTTANPAVGSTISTPSAELPAGWASTNENNTGTVTGSGDSLLGSIDASVSNTELNFGIRETVAEVTVALSGFPTSAAPETSVTGTVTCTNSGPDVALNVSCGVPDAVLTNCVVQPAGTTLTPITNPMTVAELPKDSKLSCDVTATMPPSGTLDLTGTTAADNDTNLTNNQDPATVTPPVAPVVDMSVSLSGFPAAAGEGDTVTGTVTCSNVGNVPAPAPTCGVTGLTGATVTCTPDPIPDPLAVGDSITCAVSFTAPGTSPITVTGTTGATGDSVDTNNTTSTPIVIVDAVDDAETTPKDTAKTASVTENDAYPANSTFAKASDPTNGSVTVNPDGSYTYTPNDGYVGTDSFTYTVCLPDPNQAVCDTATVVIGIFGAAVDDNVTVGPEGQIGALDALGEVTQNGDPVNPEDVEITVINQASHPGVILDPATGLVNIAPGTPPGTYTIECLVCLKSATNASYRELLRTMNLGDEVTGASSGADLSTDLPCVKVLLTIIVTPETVSLGATNDEFSTPFNTGISQRVSANDAYPPGAVFNQISDPTHGTLVFNVDGSFTYTPKPGFSGVDSFRYEVCNGTTCSAATVTITVRNGVSPPPPQPNPIPTLGEWGQIIMMLMMLLSVGYYSRRAQRR